MKTTHPHLLFLHACLHACLRAVLIAPALLVCAAERAHASDVGTTHQTAPVTDLQQVVVTGARHDARRDDTASRLVVTKDELLKFGDSTLAEAIKRLPGVSVATGAPGRSGAVSLRGMGQGYTQILVNGQAAPNGFDIGSLSPEMVERIEILRTATADMRGEAIAGTINIVLAKAARADSDEFKLGVGVSNGQHSPGLHWSRSRRDEHRSYALNGALSRREFLVEETGVETGYDAAGVQNVRRSTDLRVDGHRDAFSLAPNLALTLENGDTLAWQSTLDASQYAKHADIEWESQIGPPLQHARYRQFTGIDVVQLRSDLAWTHEFDRVGKLATRLSLGGNRESYRFREQGYAADGAQNLDDVTDAKLRVHHLGSSGKYSWPDSEKHAPEAGWEGSLDRRRESRMQHLRAIAAQPGSISNLSFDAQIRRFAVYAHDEWKVTPRWSLYLGARWERIETRSDEIRNDVHDSEKVRNRASVLSPVLQSLWKLSDSRSDQFRLGVSRSYRSPELRSLIARPYTSTNNRELNPDLQGNPALTPELATGFDLAYEKYWDEGVMFSVGAYARTIEDVIRTETRRVGERWVASPINGGDATAWGIEFDTKFSLAPVAGAPADTPSIDIHFNLTRNWSRVADIPGPHNRIDTQPRLTSTLAADYRIDPAWTLGLGYSYRSGGPAYIARNQVESESPRREVDLYALADVVDGTRLRLSVGNLLQQDIVTGAAYFDASGTRQIERRRDSPMRVRVDLEMDF